MTTRQDTGAEPVATSEVSEGEAGDVPAVSTRLSDEDLTNLAYRFRDRKPTHPCPVCMGAEWSIGACGMGRETWVCKAAATARPTNWEHYGASRFETTSGNPDVLALIAEVRERRSTRESELTAAFGAGVDHGFGWTSEQNMIDAVGDANEAAIEYAREVISAGSTP